MESKIISSIETAIVKLSDQVTASHNDHVKANGFAGAVEKLANARLACIDAKLAGSVESSKKNS